ncbi:hypothetical protein TNCV_766441 [Trichonephila clavipes]|nr:hypothetical protein TNCV_766441 [Trichonephila clavipes]
MGEITSEGGKEGEPQQMKTGPEGSESGNPGSVHPGARSNKREFVRGKVSMIVRNGRHQEGSLIKDPSRSLWMRSWKC